MHEDAEMDSDSESNSSMEVLDEEGDDNEGIDAELSMGSDDDEEQIAEEMHAD